ncbi:MAG: hypothetical protein KKG00_01515 [Bacteroidetes bacterium]|nr:hypothetical protein [Bacteroidota bacterium]
MKQHLFFVCLLLGAGMATSAQPLRLLPANPHYFLYKEKPTVIVGSGEHYGAVMNLAFDYERYLNTLQSDGMNNTRLFTGAYYEKPGAFGIEKNTLAPPADKLILPWQKTGNQYDLFRWNEAFFDRLRDFMSKASQRGVIVEITLFSSYYGAGWAYHPFHGANNVNGTPADLPATRVNTLNNGSIIKFQEAYTRKLVQELNSFDNFYFEIQNEPWAEGKDTVLVWNDYTKPTDLKEPGNYWKNTLEIASQASREWHRAVFGWIADEEGRLPKKHLISHNIANFKLPVLVSDPRIDIYTFHYASPEAVRLNYGLDKVIGFNETGFAGKDDDTYRRQAWRFMLSGGGLFNHLDYSFSVGSEDGTDLSNNAPGGGSPALRRYFKILKEYLEALHLPSLQPNDTALRHAEGAFTYTMKDNRQWVVYMEPFVDAAATLHLHLPAATYRLDWTDVRTGQIIKTEKVRLSSNAKITTPAGAFDKVVRIRKE